MGTLGTEIGRSGWGQKWKKVARTGGFCPIHVRRTEELGCGEADWRLAWLAERIQVDQVVVEVGGQNPVEDVLERSGSWQQSVADRMVSLLPTLETVHGQIQCIWRSNGRGYLEDEESYVELETVWSVD